MLIHVRLALKILLNIWFVLFITNATSIFWHMKQNKKICVFLYVKIFPPRCRWPKCISPFFFKIPDVFGCILLFLCCLFVCAICLCSLGQKRTRTPKNQSTFRNSFALLLGCFYIFFFHFKVRLYLWFLTINNRFYTISCQRWILSLLAPLSMTWSDWWSLFFLSFPPFCVALPTVGLRDLCDVTIIIFFGNTTAASRPYTIDDCLSLFLVSARAVVGRIVSQSALCRCLTVYKYSVRAYI